MRQSEYEARRRALEAQFHADVELLRASYLAKLRALESLWVTSAETALPAGETLRLPAAEIETAPSLPPPPPEPALPRGQVMDDLERLFADLPEEFEKRDVIRLLGYEPPRSTLNRALSDLLLAKRMKIARHSIGNTRTLYRKLPEEPR